ncbi:hypothetical protein GCM10017708_00380 [Arthrobacter citreus]
MSGRLQPGWTGRRTMGSPGKGPVPAGSVVVEGSAHEVGPVIGQPYEEKAAPAPHPAALGMKWAKLSLWPLRRLTSQKLSGAGAVVA